MTSCCTSASCDAIHSNKHRCPVNGQAYSEVPARTIAHHILDSWHWQQTANEYFFCDDPSCDVVYFGDDGSTIVKSQLRIPVGVKETAADTLLCYCFGVSKKDFQTDPTTRDFVIAQTKADLCSCETSNPSGRCCLKDFPKQGI